MFAISKIADLSLFVQGGQPYWAFPLTKTSLVHYSALFTLLVGSHVAPRWYHIGPTSLPHE